MSRATFYKSPEVSNVILGFESSTCLDGTLSKKNTKTSLLSQMLATEAQVDGSQYSSQYSQYSEDEEDDLSNDNDEASEEEDDDLDLGHKDGSFSGTNPIRIPSSKDFIKRQHEALKKFSYIHQIEEMRKQVEAFYDRQRI
uniref:Uncharacterized protein n=1 Tax=Polytomella parva TaxID=51329 RepID=A0A7S0YPJ3_9CHLO|mmetsp:Transcript_31270/g.56759  ORF Transcript_31270/g.56759 Transcript_31270/m.56759 type:complete len:141 (+) Transcript_31270:85-507(+)|eukprot:CAMPEP_0175042374 /NCGR_PEP_ID=MMETSP0052_2-20121109/2528_1 /TAXON_ID=51329 ORGANISM="Polytomella parva, Strain SAG 63-3" /NCGR_SAMPLE_ID=MMETSP0052_2 /ASSEMBLY_ACC=CAM_ASM_000194 /LENGTH=140 /DNA_ID=CAMNT_0016305179 /DNA_START=32 /DNA_END=454 /DNA_ORIENTATION=+